MNAPFVLPPVFASPLTQEDIEKACAELEKMSPAERRALTGTPENWTAFAPEDDPFGLDWSWLFISDEEYNRLSALMAEMDEMEADFDG